VSEYELSRKCTNWHLYVFVHCVLQCVCEFLKFCWMLVCVCVAVVVVVLCVCGLRMHANVLSLLRLDSKIMTLLLGIIQMCIYVCL